MQQLNIMVVEDEGLVSLYLQKTLKGFGYKIASSAFSGEEALRKVGGSGQKTDLVLMDYQLKGLLNGVETAILIRQTFDVPIIFLTAYSNNAVFEEIIGSEPFGYLIKPVDERVLHTTIQTAISRHRLEIKLKEHDQLLGSQNTDLERQVKQSASKLEVANLKLTDQIGLGSILETKLRLFLEKETVAENWWLLEKVIEASSSGFIITDPAQEGHPIIYVNKGFERITGYSSDEVIGWDCRFLQGTDSDQEARSLMQTALATGKQCDVEVQNFRKDGTLFWNELQILPIRNAQGDISNYVIIQNDISSRKQAEEQLSYLAFHDSLTHLPNRALFMHDLERALLRRRLEGHFVGVLFLDLDRFKLVNDSLGHDAGDQLLKAVAERLKSCARQEDLVARLGGDEFTILMDDVRSIAEATRLATRILAAFKAPFLLAGREVFATISIGIALSNAEDKTSTSMMRSVDVALYQAKNKGKACFKVFEPTMNVQALERLELEGQLGRSLEREEFVVYYQPKVKLNTGQIVGMEALVRWNNPKSGLTFPAKFIPVAEETGLILPLGKWVLEEASRQAYEWHRQGIGEFPIVMSVNLSSRQFQQTDLVDQVATILKETNLPAHLLELEITESVVMEDAELTIKTLKELKNLGVHLAIDNFGTGYSSLSYLKRFGVDTLKIDRSFVSGLDQEQEQEMKAIVQAVISLSVALNLEVIAEGVETGAQVEQLQLLGCNLGQGFYFAKAVNAETATQLLKQLSITPKIPHYLELDIGFTELSLLN